MQILELSLAGVFTHGGGHFSVGGMVGEVCTSKGQVLSHSWLTISQMADMYSSPGDPLFWLHHGMLDNIWNEWQRASQLFVPPFSQKEIIDFVTDFSTRKDEIGGPDTM